MNDTSKPKQNLLQHPYVKWGAVGLVAFILLFFIINSFVNSLIKPSKKSASASAALTAKQASSQTGITSAGGVSPVAGVVPATGQNPQPSGAGTATAPGVPTLGQGDATNMQPVAPANAGPSAVANATQPQAATTPQIAAPAVAMAPQSNSPAISPAELQGVSECAKLILSTQIKYGFKPTRDDLVQTEAACKQATDSAYLNAQINPQSPNAGLPPPADLPISLSGNATQAPTAPAQAPAR